jgi:RNA polymerase primary sigma factor
MQQGRLQNESPEGRSLLLQMTERPLLGREKEHHLAKELWRLRALIAQVKESAEESEDSAMAQEFQRQLKLLEAEYTEQRDSFFAANIKLVLGIISRMTRMEYMEMFQQGCLGLMRAIDKFDPSQNVAFSTYATRWIRQAVQRNCDNEESLITIPVHVRVMIKTLRRANIRFLQEQKREPSFEELCAFADLDPERVAHVQVVGSIPRSLEKMVGTSPDSSLYDSLPLVQPQPLEDIIEQERKQELRIAVHTALLALEQYTTEEGGTSYQRNAKVIRLRYRIGEPPDPTVAETRTLSEVGRLMVDDLNPEGISDDAARQLQRVGIRWIVEQCHDILSLFREDT